MRTSRIPAVAAAVTLLVAAGTKAREAPAYGFGDVGTGGGLLGAGLIFVECLLALWLLIGPWPGWTRWVPGTVFAGFACVAFWKGVSGAESCGCFGRVTMNPWVTFTMDVILAACLYRWPPREELIGSTVPWWRSLRVRAVAVVLVAGLFVGAGVWLAPTPVADAKSPELTVVGNTVILDATQWIGKPYPLLGHIENGDELRVGQWLVVLHQAHCSTCEEALPGYALQAGGEGRIAFVQLPPHAEEALDDIRFAGVLPLRLTAEREWFASTPVVALMHDGVVSDAVEGMAAVGAIADWSARRLQRASSMIP